MSVSVFAFGSSNGDFSVSAGVASDRVGLLEGVIPVWMPNGPGPTYSIVSVRTAMRVQRRYRVYCVRIILSA